MKDFLARLLLLPCHLILFPIILLVWVVNVDCANRLVDFFDGLIHKRNKKVNHNG